MRVSSSSTSEMASLESSATLPAKSGVRNSSSEEYDSDSDDDTDSSITETSSDPMTDSGEESEVGTDLPEEAPTVDWYRHWAKDKEVGRHAERKREAKIASAEPAERYSRAESVWRALNGPGVMLLRASYLIDLAKDKHGILQRRQDLPDKAFLSLAQLQRIHAEASPVLTGFDGVLPIVAVSACWLSATHADPRGEQLRLIGATLERELPKYRAVAPDGRPGFEQVGVFWDWGSLHQADPVDGGNTERTEVERTHFEGALNDMDLWFGHQGIVSLLLNSLPPAPERKGPRGKSLKGQRKRSRTYSSSGWTFYESRAAQLKRFSRPRRHLHGGTWEMVITPGATKGAAVGEKPGAPPVWPMVPPDDFAKLLDDKSFARSAADRSRVSQLYAKQCASQLGGLARLSLSTAGVSVGSKEAELLGRCVELCPRLTELHLSNVAGFGDDALIALCSALGKRAGLRGPLANRISHLTLDGNGLGNAGVKVLAWAASKGALRSLRALSLARNSLGMDGLLALAAASRRPAALPQLLELNLYANAIGSERWEAVGKELRGGAFGPLHSLFLGSNGLGTDGCVALAKACTDDDEGVFDEKAPLPALQRLHLYGNGIGRHGAIAIGKALHEWALRSCVEIVLDGNSVGRRAIAFVADALHRREWARVTLHQWRHQIHEDQKQAAYGLKAGHRRRVVLPSIAQWRVESQFR